LALFEATVLGEKSIRISVLCLCLSLYQPLISYADVFSFAFSSFAFLSILSLNLSPNKLKCCLITIVYLTNSSMQSTSRSLFPLGINLLPSSEPSFSVNCVYTLGIELWFGIVNMRIHRPRIRREFTVLKDCEPPLHCAIASVRPCVGRTEPVESGIQSIWFLKTAVWSWVLVLRRSGNVDIAYKIPMLFRTNPDMAITPSAQFP